MTRVSSHIENPTPTPIFRRLRETRQVQAVIVGMEEDRLPIVTPLDDMLRDV